MSGGSALPAARFRLTARRPGSYPARPTPAGRAGWAAARRYGQVPKAPVSVTAGAGGPG
jgi:hypothetical protein